MTSKNSSATPVLCFFFCFCRRFSAISKTEIRAFTLFFMWNFIGTSDIIYCMRKSIDPWRCLPLKIELTEQQYRYLLDLVYIGNWVLNSTRGDDRIKEYDQVESLVFSHCLQHKMSKLVELYQGELIPSRAFADGGIHEAIETYEDILFYELLAEELALRDLDGEPLTGENYKHLLERIDVYLAEFNRHGTDNLSIDIDE